MIKAEFVRFAARREEAADADGCAAGALSLLHEAFEAAGEWSGKEG